MTLRHLLSNRWLRVLLNVLAVAAIWLLVNAYQTRKHVTARAGAAPDFTLTNLEGRSVSLREFAGRKVVLHFFATWCGVCRAELPSVKSFFEHLKPDEVLLAVAEDADDLEALRRYAREHDLRYPILLGTPEVLRAYAVTAFPTNYYLNGDRSVSGSSVGLSTRLGMELRLLGATSR